MKFIDHVHRRSFVANRRARVLSHQLAKIIPDGFRHVLDVGCGDGLIAYLIAETRPDIKLTRLGRSGARSHLYTRRTFRW